MQILLKCVRVFVTFFHSVNDATARGLYGCRLKLDRIRSGRAEIRPTERDELSDCLFLNCCFASPEKKAEDERGRS